ncbi:hypothetical protein DXV76_03160 [Rhodobacteraceae bacterium CCMM004]|nr:hypothetical protein DXV76_03160 [Rhodobacteraceae bacterium CCMM004]
MQPRRIVRSTWLPAPPERVWSLLERPQTLAYVSAPLMRFEPVGGPWPETWHEGTWRVRVRGLGGVPMGWQEIRISFPPADPPVRRVRDNGRGALARRWDHVIEVAPEGDGTRYTDTVEVEAGLLTPAVAAFAGVFYAHRQRRWHTLIG